jgi:hypothetical protein
MSAGGGKMICEVCGEGQRHDPVWPAVTGVGRKMIAEGCSLSAEFGTQR